MAKANVKRKPRDVALTADYTPTGYYSPFYYSRNRPAFTVITIREMLVDPRINFGLRLIKGPITSQYKVSVKADTEEARAFIDAEVKRFWRNSAYRMLRALEWGYAGSEVLYRYDGEGRLRFDTTRDLDSTDLRPVVYEGRIVGMVVRNVPNYQGGLQTTYNQLVIPRPKFLWHVYERHKNPWFGASILYPASVPWWELWSEGGFRDARRLWYYKNSFEGGIMYHPPGITRLETGQVVSNRDLARELIEKKRTGGVLTLPNELISENIRAWEYQPPHGNTAPTGLESYGADLRSEIFEALGIPPEVIEDTRGEGPVSGRKVPLIAFYSTLQEIGNWLLTDFDEYVLSFLVEYNFGPTMNYELNPIPMTDIISKNITGETTEVAKIAEEIAKAEEGEETRKEEEGEGIEEPTPEEE